MRLASFRVGEGASPVVLLHGYLGSGRNLRTLATQWSQRDPDLTFLLPDLTGHGESPPFPPDPTLESVARDVLETADAEGLTGRLRWVGHSFGGRVCLAAARLAPDRVSRVDLLDISPGAIPAAQSESGAVLDLLVSMPEREEDRATMQRRMTDAGLSTHLAAWLATNLIPDPAGGVKWRFDRAGLQRAHLPVLAEDLWDVVEAKAVPLRLAKGNRSAYVPAADVARMRDLGVEVVELESGHFVHVSALDALVEWLDAV
ncbi:MAG: alpha/beta hydrolase [Myxococcota bacterium]|nr:alpha/beta hydrolase [Myxococcota bacterium]